MSRTPRGCCIICLLMLFSCPSSPSSMFIRRTLPGREGKPYNQREAACGRDSTFGRGWQLRLRFRLRTWGHVGPYHEKGLLWPCLRETSATTASWIGVRRIFPARMSHSVLCQRIAAYHRSLPLLIQTERLNKDGIHSSRISCTPTILLLWTDGHGLLFSYGEFQ